MSKLILLSLIIVVFSPSVRSQEANIGGVYEVAIGTTNADAHIKYWERFGYRVGQSGELSAEDAFKLYGVRSKLKSIRLLHQDADHGLIRLFVWEKPTNDGLQMANMKIIGNRWGAMLTNDIYNLQNHAEEAIAQKKPIFLVEPQRAEIYKLEKRPVPFLENYATVREMCLIQPEMRQIMFQRFGYSLPFYGTVNEQSFFKSSQITHYGMVVLDNRENLDFYDKVLGLLRARDSLEYGGTYESESSRAVFSLEKGERYSSTDFDDPRSSTTDPAKARSGRLKIIRFAPDSKLINKMEYSKPGSLGYSLYTYKVRGIENYHQKVKQSTAKNVTDILKNEFGEKSFSFTAPDGYFWTIIE